MVANNITELVGRTPMVKINKLIGPGAAKVYAKLEFLNPGGSIKDRIGLSMIEAAEKKGLIKPGYTIVEPTSGTRAWGWPWCRLLKDTRSFLRYPTR